MKFKKCENCNKFSHCNNNNLVCMSEYNKLYKTLTEIKEIAKAESYLSPQSTRLLVHNILNKISEVLDE